MSGFDSGYDSARSKISHENEAQEARKRELSERVFALHNQLRSWQKLRDWGCTAVADGPEIMIKSSEGVDLFKIEIAGNHIFGTDILNIQHARVGPGFTTEDFDRVPEFIGSAFARSIDELKKNPARAHSAGLDLSRFD